MSEIVSHSTPHKQPRGILGTSAVENASPAVVSSAKQQQHVSQRKRVAASQSKSKDLQQTPMAASLPSVVDLRIPIQSNGGKEPVHVALRTSRSIDVSANQSGIPLITSASSMSKNCVEPLVDRALLGFNANILVLGPSHSSSRTSLKGGQMWGSSEKSDKEEEKENSAGPSSRFAVNKDDSVIALALERLFGQIQEERNGLKPSSFLVAMSVMSISPSDALVDCLTMGNPSALPLKLQQDASSRLQIVNLTRRLLHSKAHALKALQPIVDSIEKQELKDGSNKNHVIVIVHIERKDGETGVCSTSQLQFIDLAALENYNTSLLALEKVVTALAKIASDQILHSAASALMSPTSAASQAPVSSPRHIPYRESKLTRLLKCGLGGSETPFCRTHSLFLVCTDSIDSSDIYLKFAKKLTLLSNNMSTAQEGLNIIPAIQSLHFQLESAGVKLKHHTNLPVISGSKTTAARLPYSKQDSATSRVRRQLFDSANNASTIPSEKVESACKIVAPIAKKGKAVAAVAAPIVASAVITTAATPTPPTPSTPAKAESSALATETPSSSSASGSARRWKFGSARSATKPASQPAPAPTNTAVTSASSGLADTSASIVSIHSASKRLSTATEMMMCSITEGEEISSTSTSMESKASLVDTPPKVVAETAIAAVVESEVPTANAASTPVATVTPAPTRRWTFKNKNAPPAQSAALLEMERKYKEMETRLQDALTEVQSLTAQQVESEREIAAIKSGQRSDAPATRLATTLQCDLLRNEMDALRQQINESTIDQAESTPQIEAPVSNASPEPEIELTFILDDESLQHGNVSTPSRTGLTPTVDFLSPTSSLEGASPCQFIMDDLRGTFSSAADELEQSRSASPPPVRGRPSFRLSIVRESFGSTSSGRPSYGEQYDEEDDDEELSELDEQLEDDGGIDQSDLNEIEDEAPEVPIEEPFTPAATTEKEEEVVEYEQEEKFDTESTNHILAAASPAAAATAVKSIPSELLEQIRLLTANAHHAIQQQQPAEAETMPIVDVSADIINSSQIVPEVMEPIAEEESFSADVQEAEKEEEPEVIVPITLSKLVLRLPFYCPSTIIHSYTTSAGDTACFPTCIAFLNGVNFPLFCARSRRVVPLVRFVSINPVVAYFPFKSSYTYHHASAFSSPQARSNVARARARAAAVAPATPLSAASPAPQKKANDAAMTESQALIDRAARIKAKKDAEWQQATLMQKIGCSVM